MKKVLLAFTLTFSSLLATDYSSMSLDELKSLRGSVPAEDKAAFQSSMQSKVQALSPEERKATMQKSQSGNKATDGSGQQMRKGGGSGQGRR